MSLTRRHFLSAALLAPALARQAANSLFISTVPLGNVGGAPTPPFGRLLGAGLDARLFTDLSLVGEPVTSRQSSVDTLVTPADRFFVRTAFPSSLSRTDPWTIGIGGLVRKPLEMNLRSLEPLIAPGGRWLIECSGNADQSNYGLMSTADWEGVPLTALLDRVQPSAPAYRVLVSGVDDEGTSSRASVPGASWIFSRDDLPRAVLAVGMNGAPLARDHGLPVRLVVPGWYGCACIKWVDRIDLVPDDAPATKQMQEFAARTHQDPRAVLAREFTPAVIDTAALPVRVEKWLIERRVAYRVTGIIWGGSKPTNALAIRFRSTQPWVPVDDCPMPASTLTWSLWSHLWRPDAPGRYQIVLRVDDSSIRTRRLDLFFYVREIDIDEI